MEILSNNDVLPKGLAIALGAFDGIHIGHRRLIENIVDYSKEHNCKSCVYTFDTLPSGARYINDSSQRIAIFESLGVDYLYIQRFDENFRCTSAKGFMDKFIKDASYVTVGFNFRFGKGREGNTGLLKDYCSQNGTVIHIQEPVYFGDEIVSSTKIRGYIEEDNFCTAGKMLGRNFCVNGVVIHGNAVGRTIGFPTMNQRIPEKKLTPAFGVYASRVYVDGEYYVGISNLGRKPTIEGEHKTGLETYLLDYNGDLYGKKLKTELLYYIRPEEKFTGIDELTKQIHNDIETKKQMM